LQTYSGFIIVNTFPGNQIPDLGIASALLSSWATWKRWQNTI